MLGALKKKQMPTNRAMLKYFFNQIFLPTLPETERPTLNLSAEAQWEMMLSHAEEGNLEKIQVPKLQGASVKVFRHEPSEASEGGLEEKEDRDPVRANILREEDPSFEEAFLHGHGKSKLN